MQAQPLRNRHDYGENPPPTEPIISKVAKKIVVADMAEKVERQHFLEVAKQIQNVSVAFSRLVGCVTEDDSEEAMKAAREMNIEIDILMQRANFVQDEVYDAVQNEKDEEIDAEYEEGCQCGI